jgi:hypothetical protein
MKVERYAFIKISVHLNTIQQFLFLPLFQLLLESEHINMYVSFKYSNR